MSIVHTVGTKTPLLIVVAASCIVFLATSCAHTDMQDSVVGFPGQQTLALSADDVVQVMRRAGFKDTEILKHGPHLRNQMATVGGARIRTQNGLAAIFAISGNRIHASSRRTGTFVYELKAPSQGLIPSE